jgi:hypothetical protein
VPTLRLELHLLDRPCIEGSSTSVFLHRDWPGRSHSSASALAGLC